MDIYSITLLIQMENIQMYMHSLWPILISTIPPLPITWIQSILAKRDLLLPQKHLSDQPPLLWTICRAKRPTRRRQGRPTATCTRSGFDQLSSERRGRVPRSWIYRPVGVKLKLVEDFTSSFRKTHQTSVESRIWELLQMKGDIPYRKQAFMCTIFIANGS